MDISIFTELFWLFFAIATSILTVWISILFRSQKSLASVTLMISAIIDASLSIFNAIYWNLWPAGSIFSAWTDHDPFAEPESLLTKIATVSSNLSALLFVIWLIALLFVAFRFHAELARIRQMQVVLEQKIQGADPDP